MAPLLFGTGGSPHSSRTASTVDGIRRIAELGLTCMEVEFVQGVRMGEASARQVAAVASELGIGLTAHAPYFINLNAVKPEKIKASQMRLKQTAHIGALCGAKSVVFHAAFYLGSTPEETYLRVKNYAAEVLDELKREGNHIWMRPEVMGRPTQFGTVAEIIRMSNELERVMPGIDFAHWHARCGVCNSYEEFASVLQQLKEHLGRQALDEMHMHVSGIKFSGKGEIKHLNLKESDFNYKELLRALKDYRAGGFVICESPNLEEDALLLQSTYNSM